MDVIELELRYTSAQPFSANVLSQSGSEFDSRATERVERYYQQWGSEHMNVWLRELLCDQGRNYPDSL